jgi:mannitol-1-/sugar-/sorbitol-6-/2-deoxyglucose-6-phosphatase
MIVFDMDGLLIDSEPLWVRAEIEVFGAHGLPLTELDCATTKGLRVDDVVRHWHAVRAFADLDRVERDLVARVAELVRAEGVALRGAAAAVARAKALGPIALASSSPTLIIEAALDRLGLASAFDVVQSAETEPYGKPHPGIFLRTAERLRVSPLACTVLEDSMNGVIAAKAARMRCIAIPPEPDPRFAVADAVVASLDDVTEPVLRAAICRT